MLSRKLDLVRWFNKINKAIVSSVLSILMVLIVSSCDLIEGSIMIYEEFNGTGFTVEMKKFSSFNEWEMYLAAGEEVKVEVIKQSGEIALRVIGKNNGNEPYTGNDLKTGMFTIAVSKSDYYIFRIKGDNATGKIIIKNLRFKEE